MLLISLFYNNDIKSDSKEYETNKERKNKVRVTKKGKKYGKNSEN